jgi:hypothetical protein
LPRDWNLETHPGICYIKRRYQHGLLALESAGLHLPNWVNLGSPMTAAGNTLMLEDTNSLTSSPTRFYRVLVSP